MRHSVFSSDRLHMDLVTRRHASLLYPILRDPMMYRFIPSHPPSLEELEKRYTFWEARESPDKSEYWLNYVVSLRGEETYIGTLQAGVNRETRHASIAYMIGSNFQGRGLGTEATRALLAHLRDEYAVNDVKAWIDTRNQASIKLVENLGMQKIEFLKDADHFKGSTSDEFVYQLKNLSAQ